MTPKSGKAWRARGPGEWVPEPGESPRGETLEGSMMTVGTKLRKMWLQSVRTAVLLNATSSSSMASRSRRSPSFCRYSKEASCQSRGAGTKARAGGLKQGLREAGGEERVPFPQEVRLGRTAGPWLHGEGLPRAALCICYVFHRLDPDALALGALLTLEGLPPPGPLISRDGKQCTPEHKPSHYPPARLTPGPATRHLETVPVPQSP